MRVVHEGELLCGHDIALLRLTAPLSEDVATPLDVPRDVPSDGATTAIIYRAVGYGAVHPSGTGEKVRRVSEPLDVQCDSPATCANLVLEGTAGAPNLPSPEIANGEWLGQAAGCPGDSGGPALIETNYGQAIIGVLSRGHSDCSLNIYSFPQSPAFRQAVRDMIPVDESGPIYEFPSWSVETAEPDPPTGEGAAGGLGGMGGAGDPPVEKPSETGGDLSASPSDVASWHADPGCGCRLSGPARGRASWDEHLFVLILLSFWGARRRSTEALDSKVQ